MEVVIEFDPVKDAANRQKHGLSLRDADRIDWSTLKSLHDERFDYGENRQVGFAFIGKRLHACVYTYRGMNLRIISLRKANKKERKCYEKQA